VSEKTGFMRTVLFCFEADLELDEKEIWPDGDAPENWTPADVAAVVRSCGGPLAVLRDWDLGTELRLRICGDGEGADV
jgi:hypothetical protein